MDITSEEYKNFIHNLVESKIYEFNEQLKKEIKNKLN